MLAAAVAWFAGAVLASHHPLHPQIALLGFAAWSWIALRSDAWPIVLLGALPIAHAGPWTGWIVSTSSTWWHGAVVRPRRGSRGPFVLGGARLDRCRRYRAGRLRSCAFWRRRCSRGCAHSVTRCCRWLVRQL